MKLTGIIIIMLACTTLGCGASDSLKRRLMFLRQVRCMTEAFEMMIRYEAADVNEMVSRLCTDAAYSRLDFLQFVRERTDNGQISFHDAWTASVEEKCGWLTEADRGLLIRIGSNLGTTDCEGQIAALELAQLETDRLTAEAEEKYRSSGRLYRALGVIGGAAAALIAV